MSGQPNDRNPFSDSGLVNLNTLSPVKPLRSSLTDTPSPSRKRSLARQESRDTFTPRSSKKARRVPLDDNPMTRTKQTAIARLNKEDRLLLHLFAFCDPRTCITIALVCNSWRKTALSSTQLWTTLDLPYTLVHAKALDNLLPRSAGFQNPLELSLQVSLQSNLSILRPQCRRIRSLKLTAYTRLPYVSSSAKLCLNAKMPQLVELEVAVPKPHANAFELPDDLFGGVAPKLERLALQNVLLPLGLDECGALSRIKNLTYAPGEPASHRGSFIEQAAKLLIAVCKNDALGQKKIRLKPAAPQPNLLVPRARTPPPQQFPANPQPARLSLCNKMGFRRISDDLKMAAIRMRQRGDSLEDILDIVQFSIRLWGRRFQPNFFLAECIIFANGNKVFGELETLVLTIPHGTPDQSSDTGGMRSASLRSLELVSLDRMSDCVRRAFTSRLCIHDNFPSLANICIPFTSAAVLSLVTGMTAADRLEVSRSSFVLCADTLRTTLYLPNTNTKHILPLDRPTLSQITTLHLEIESLSSTEFVGVSLSATTLEVNEVEDSAVEFSSVDSRSLIVAGNNLTDLFPNVTVVKVRGSGAAV